MLKIIRLLGSALLNKLNTIVRVAWEVPSSRKGCSASPEISVQRQSVVSMSESCRDCALSRAALKVWWGPCCPCCVLSLSTERSNPQEAHRQWATVFSPIPTWRVAAVHNHSRRGPFCSALLPARRHCCQSQAGTGSSTESLTASRKTLRWGLLTADASNSGLRAEADRPEMMFRALPGY